MEKGPYELGLRVRISTKNHSNPSFNNPRIVRADKTTGRQIFSVLAVSARPRAFHILTIFLAGLS